MSDDNYDPFDDIFKRLSKLEEVVFRREAIKEFQGQGQNGVVVSHPDTLINTLADGTRDIVLKATIVKVDAIQKGITKEGKDWSFQPILIGDYTGQIQLQLWDDMIDEYKHLRPNDAIIIRGGYVKEYKGKKQLRIAKGGKIEVQGGHII